MEEHRRGEDDHDETCRPRHRAGREEKADHAGRWDNGVEAAEKESYYNHDSLKTLDASHHKKYTDTPVEAIVEPLLPSAVYLQHKLDYTWNGEKCFIPQFTEFTNVVTIAGYEQKNPIRDVERLVNAYHRPAQDWKKQAGSVTSDQYEFDLHWYEAKDGIQHEVKLKNRKERRI